MTKLPVFKKNKCSYLCNNFVSVWKLEILLASLNHGKNCEIFLEWQFPLYPKLYLKRNKLIHLLLALLGFFPMCKIFPIIDQCRFLFTSGIGPHILMNVLKVCIIFFIWAACVLFTFYLNQKEVFSLKLYWKCLLHFLPWRNSV